MRVVVADGRVAGTSDWSRADGPHIIERHLSARGRDLLRTGELDAREFLVIDTVDHQGRRTIAYSPRRLVQPTTLWAEPTARVYEPSKYAICTFGQSFNAPDVVVQLPEPAQALLNGKQRSYDLRDPRMPKTMDCFELTATELVTLQQIMPPTTTRASGGEYAASWTFAFGTLYAAAITPHGELVLWGG